MTFRGAHLRQAAGREARPRLPRPFTPTLTSFPAQRDKQHTLSRAPRRKIVEGSTSTPRSDIIAAADAVPTVPAHAQQDSIDRKATALEQETAWHVIIVSS
jgi:hypothetical protein